MDRETWWAYSPWGCKELDTTEWLTLNTYLQYLSNKLTISFIVLSFLLLNSIILILLWSLSEYNHSTFKISCLCRERKIKLECCQNYKCCDTLVVKTTAHFSKGFRLLEQSPCLHMKVIWVWEHTYGYLYIKTISAIRREESFKRFYLTFLATEIVL